MSEESLDYIKTHWFIDLEWFEHNNRSINVLLEHLLCDRCLSSIKKTKNASSVSEFISAIRDCFDHNPNYINDRLPILEIVFRLILMSGNQPSELRLIAEQISKLRGGNPHTWAELLSRLLVNDQFYGFKPV